MQKRLTENDGNGFIKPRGSTQKAGVEMKVAVGSGTWRVEISKKALHEIRREGSEQQCLRVSHYQDKITGLLEVPMTSRTALALVKPWRPQVYAWLEGSHTQTLFE